jgi:hypothetical protein
MKKTFAIILFVLFFGIVNTAWAEWEEEAIIKEKRQKIETEIALLKAHFWAGQYYFGDGLGANVTLTVAPENGFTITWFGCLGLYDQNHGTVEWDGNIVKFSFAFPVKDGYIGRYASEYKPIRWGERVYLIPTDEIIDFCNAINSRSEPRNGAHGFFFLRDGDEKKQAKGKPELPKEFMPYLLDKPVDAKIVSIKDVREEQRKDVCGEDYIRRTVTVVVNKGKRDGLLPGMELHVTKPDMIFDEVKLTNVEETQSEGVFVANLWGARKEATPSAGWQLSTCPSWRRDRDISDKNVRVLPSLRILPRRR